MSELTDKANALLAGRVSAIAKLEEAVRQEAAVNDQLSAARRATHEAWTAAEAAGWTRAELKQIGIPAPATRRGGRPKGSRAKPVSRTSDAAAQQPA